jgi:hypothetical protein
MRMFSLVAAALAALSLTGLAVAKRLDTTKSAAAVSGTFTATTPGANQTKTCTTAEGKTIDATNARYTGTAVGQPALAGAITLDVRTAINTTDGIGVIEGKLRIDVASGDDTVARFVAVYDHGKVAGLATGELDESDAKLIANISAGFSAAGGFTDGRLGNSAGGAAVALGPGKCNPATAHPAGTNQASRASGTISALSQTSITVAGLTCAIPASLAARVGEHRVGDRAEIRCMQVGGQNTLVKFKGKEKDKDDD